MEHCEFGIGCGALPAAASFASYGEVLLTLSKAELWSVKGKNFFVHKLFVADWWGDVNLYVLNYGSTRTYLAIYLHQGFGRFIHA